MVCLLLTWMLMIKLLLTWLFVIQLVLMTLKNYWHVY